MSIGVFLTIVLPFFVSVNSALPSDLRRSPIATKDVDSITRESILTTPNPYTAHTVSCLNTHSPPTLIPSDCGSILIKILFLSLGAFQERLFKNNQYETEDGGYAPSRWHHGNCEVSVHGPRHGSQLLTLNNVALTANSIVHECLEDTTDPIGGVGSIGEMGAGFHVLLHGYDAPESICANNSILSQPPAVSLSRAGSEHSARSRALEVRDPLNGVSLVANHPAITSNSTIGTIPPARYPVRCFNPHVTHLQPAAATDCSYIVNQIILRLLDPTRQLTFGFTDHDDVNLSKPEYRQWQYGQCLVSVKNRNVFQSDVFRLLDVAATARRVVTHCVVETQEKMGGTANVGTDGRGFYVYVGGLVPASPALSDVMLLRESTGVESF